MLSLLAIVAAAEIFLVPVAGEPFPAARTELEIVVTDGGRPVSGADLKVTPFKGRMVLALGEVEPGRYRYQYQAPNTGEADNIAITLPGQPTVTRNLGIQAVPTPTISAPKDVETLAGQDAIEVRFPASEPPLPEEVVAHTSEGLIKEIRTEADAVVVVVQPREDRQARVLAVGLLDLRTPGQLPVVGMVRLRSRQQADITAEPGSVVQLRVAGRTYGPFTAGENGHATVSFEVPPGVTSYEISVADKLGNTQNLQSTLPSLTRPILLAMEVPFANTPWTDVYLGSWTATGRAWSGAAPACRTETGEREPALVAGRGWYRYVVDVPPTETVMFDRRVECTLEDAAALVRVPLPSGRPERIDLKVYPETLSADFPVADIQATVLDRRGDRLDPTGLVLTANGGELALTLAAAAVRAEYRGTTAVSQGAEQITATYRLPSGTGTPWTIDLYTVLAGRDVQVRVRALDRTGRPLPEQPIQVRAGSHTVEARTDGSGWAEVTLPLPSEGAPIVIAQAAQVERRRLVLPGDALPMATADLVASLTLPIQAGRVRQIYMDAAPRPLITGAGQEATVVVRMLDAGGNLVTNEPVQIDASAGQLSAPTTRSDGSVVATYQPPTDMPIGTVRITATSAATAVSMDLELVPRPVRGALTVGGGWITNFGAVSAPELRLCGALRAPIRSLPLFARLGVSTYAIDVEVDDPLTTETINVHSQFIPIEAGLGVVQRNGRQAFEAGLAGVIAPYLLDTQYGDQPGLSGLALTSPGLQFHSGLGLRVGQAELVLEARYLLVTATTGAVSFRSTIGGLSTTLGYRLLY